MSVINITEDQMKRFQRIRDSRPQDSKARDTFDYILRVFEESPLRIEICKEITRPRNIIAGNASSPIIDADNLRIVTPSTLADKLTRDALKTTSNAIRNAYPSEEGKE
jgi:cell division FtsZ-interacting protein ZapD